MQNEFSMQQNSISYLDCKINMKHSMLYNKQLCQKMQSDKNKITENCKPMTLFVVIDHII